MWVFECYIFKCQIDILCGVYNIDIVLDHRRIYNFTRSSELDLLRGCDFYDIR